jgi:hypothetical protein
MISSFEFRTYATTTPGKSQSCQLKAGVPARLRAKSRASSSRSHGTFTSEGLKRLTVAVNPADQRLAIDAGRSVEDLMREALADLFAKHAGHE